MPRDSRAERVVDGDSEALGECALRDPFHEPQPEDYRVGQVSAQHLARHGFWIVRTASGLFAASARCTHLGCRLRHDPRGAQQVFRCACHGSAFSAAGEVLRGPASRAMDRLQLELTRQGDLLVDPGLRHRKQGGAWQPGALLRYPATRGGGDA